MNSGMKFDIMYELSCGRVIVITRPWQQENNSTYYWVSDKGNLIQCDNTGRCCGVYAINIPWQKGCRFSVKEREFKDVVTKR